MFLPLTISSEEGIRQFITANYSPPLVPPTELDRAVNKLLELYPDIPALGSPYNTGDETFGLSSSFKRLSALSMYLVFSLSFVFLLKIVYSWRSFFPVATAVLATDSRKGRDEELGILIYT
jgi:hypothetical protein